MRPRDIAWAPGTFPPGERNAITDVPGVRVGHATLVEGDGPLNPGRGPVRTGVTVILPHERDLFQYKVRAAVHTINGFGKPFGFEQVRELGLLESPVALTGTLNVGLVADALVQHAVHANPAIGVTTSTVNVVVAETNDGYLNDVQGRHVRLEHVLAAIQSSSQGLPISGSVGAGTGTVCFGWKGGIGTASRILPDHYGGFRLGALVQTNFGRPRDLTISGVPVGRFLLPPGSSPSPSPGSIVSVLATDAPLTSRQLSRLARRVSAGIARTGGQFSHGSGEFVIAFSTASLLPHWTDELVASQPFVLDEAKVTRGLFSAVIESVEEAILDSLCSAQTTVGRDGNIALALPLDQAAEIVRRHTLE